MHEPKNDQMQILLNEYLTEIDFVMDYLRLRFDTCFLTILVDPVVKTESDSYPRSSSHFCNRILQCIGRKVNSVNIKKDENLEIGFDNGYKIFVSLNPDDYVTAEALILNQDSGIFSVW